MKVLQHAVIQKLQKSSYAQCIALGLMIAFFVSTLHTLCLWFVTSELWGSDLLKTPILGQALYFSVSLMSFILGMVDIYGWFCTYTGDLGGWQFCDGNLLVNYLLDDFLVLAAVYIPTIAAAKSSLVAEGKRRIVIAIGAFLIQYVIVFLMLLSFTIPMTPFPLISNRVILPYHACIGLHIWGR